MQEYDNQLLAESDMIQQDLSNLVKIFGNGVRFIQMEVMRKPNLFYSKYTPRCIDIVVSCKNLTIRL